MSRGRGPPSLHDARVRWSEHSFPNSPVFFSWWVFVETCCYSLPLMAWLSRALQLQPNLSGSFVRGFMILNNTSHHLFGWGRKKFRSLWPLIKGIKQRQFSKLPSQPCGKSQDETRLTRLPSSWNPHETCSEEVLHSSQNTFYHNFIRKLNTLCSLRNCALESCTESHSFISFHR
jgi:hypothetical protein